MNELELEVVIPEPLELGECFYDFIDLSLLYGKLALIAQQEYDALHYISDLSYRRRFVELGRNEKLFVLALSKQSPVRIRIGAWVPEAIRAFADVVERLYNLRETRERADLDNAARRIEIDVDAVQRLGLESLDESHRIALENELLYDINRVGDRRKRIKVLDSRIQN